MSVTGAWAQATIGVDGLVKWEYDEETRTLTFSSIWPDNRPVDMQDHEGEGMQPWIDVLRWAESVKFISITHIGQSALWGGHNITSVEIPNTVTDIGGYAFRYCSSLTSVTLPYSVRSIDDCAFEGCTGLTSITVEAETPPFVWALAFEEVDKSIPVHVPNKNVVAAYQNAIGWSEFTNFVYTPRQYTLEDKTEYAEARALFVDDFTYTRHFTTADNWQSLFVPFDIAVTEDLLGKCDIAIPYMVATRGPLGSGIVDEEGDDIVVLKKLKVGDTAQHGTPYFIRPVEAGELSLQLNDITLRPASEVTSLSCATTFDDYVFEGQYTSGHPADGTWYAFNDGVFQLCDNSSSDVESQRWYMTKTSKNTASSSAPVKSMRVITLGENAEATAIVAARAGQTPSNAIYSPTGIRLAQPQKGLNIIGGRKVVVN